MATPSSTIELLDLVRKSGIYRAESLDDRLSDVQELPEDPIQCAAVLVQHGLLTRFQAKLLLTGRYKGFRLGSYVIREQLGQGGMGAVYLAEHETLRRRVALKVLTPPKDDANGKLTLERFLREARAAAALDHPNIVRTHDISQQGDVHFLVMEYVEGQTLDQMLERGGPINPSRAVGYVAQAAAGLQHAHERGFVHRDIKPANLIATKDGTVKILDMGLARSFTSESDKLTEVMDQGAILGTADYISPEQAMNAPNIDIRADIYSLGATFFALVTGKPPFGGNTTQKLVQHQMKDAPDLMTLDKTFPPELALIVAKMLHKKPEKRFQTPAEVITALAPWLSDDGGTKVMAGLSGTDLGNSGVLQNTLSEFVSNSTKRLNKSRRLGDSSTLGGNKKLWIAVGSVVSVAIVVMAVALFGGFGSSNPSVAATGTSPVITPTPVPQPQATPTPVPAPVETKKPTVPAKNTTPVVQTPATPEKGHLGYRVDFSGLMPNSVTYRERNGGGQLVGSTPLPPDWNINHYRDTTTADYMIADVGGARALGIRFLEGGIGAQIQYKGPILGQRLLVGDTVLVKLHYQYDGNSKGSAGLQQNKMPYKRHVNVELTPTNGQWREVTFSFTKPDEDGIAFIFNPGNNPDGTVWLKDLEIRVLSTGKVLHELDMTNQRAFTMQGHVRVTDPNKPTNKVWQVISRSGDGEVPVGWSARCYNVESQVEYFARNRDGGMALGMRNTNGPGSAMLFMPQFDAPTCRVRLRCEYLTEGGKETSFVLRFAQRKPTTVSAWTIQYLPMTDGVWRSFEADIDLKGATGGVLEFHNTGSTPDTVLYLRKASLMELPEGYVVPGPAPKPAPFPMAVGETLLTYDATAMTPGSYIIENRERIGESFFPEGFHGHCWKPESVAEFKCQDSSGSRAFGITNFNSTVSSQVIVGIEKSLGLTLKPDAHYRVVVEYRTANDAEAKVTVRKPGPTYDTIANSDVERGKDAWRTMTLDFKRPADSVVDLMFENQAVGEGNTVWVRKFTVQELKPLEQKP